MRSTVSARVSVDEEAAATAGGAVVSGDAVAAGGAVVAPLRSHASVKDGDGGGASIGVAL